MKVYDDSMLQSLMDSAILGLGLFMGAAVLYGFAHFTFEYIRRGETKKMGEALEASTQLRTLVETMKKNKFHSKPRWFKIGDVVKWTPAYVSQDKVDARGLGVIVKAQGPNVRVYWLGNEEVSKHDVRLPQVLQLQDLAPMPEVAEWLKSIEREYI